MHRSRQKESITEEEITIPRGHERTYESSVERVFEKRFRSKLERGFGTGYHVSLRNDLNCDLRATSGKGSIGTNNLISGTEFIGQASGT